MKETILKYWQGLEQRERWVLGGGAISVAAILFYSLLWSPLQTSLSFMDTSVQSMRTNLVWMEQRAEQIQASGGVKVSQRTPRGANQSLLAVLEQTARQAGIREAIQRLTPNQKQEVRVVLESVDFNRWVRWVDNLYKNYGVDVSSLTAERDDEKPNIAEIRVTFFRI